LWHFAGAQWQIPGHIGSGLGLHVALDHAIFQRMKADDGQPAARGKVRGGPRQHQRHFLKLPIDVNP
jgi:hypothetical protein